MSSEKITEQMLEDFIVFANAQGSGYVKPWKAQNILYMLVRVPEFKQDRERLHEYLSNCLVMEGFSEQAIKNIVVYLTKKG